MNSTSKQNKISKNSSDGSRTELPTYSRLLLHPARIVLVSFFLVIICGTFFLMLPQATVSRSLSFVDALFTATSATCVTGLVVVDTGTAFTQFGQIVILVLIQIGGLGIMTFSTFFVYLIAGRLGLTEREILQDTLSQHPMGDLARLLKLVFFFTIAIEAIGGGLLALRFIESYPIPKAIYYGLFHSISAFCNAGFGLFATSFEGYRDDIFVNAVLSVLIILGGLGFVVLFDLFKNRNQIGKQFFFKLSFHSRIVLFVTALLIGVGLIIFFVLEFDNTLKSLPFGGKILASFFQSVTARTAGFNTLKMEQLTNATLFLLIILMFVGASPGSCGGGIKTSTFAVLVASVVARFHLQEDVNIFYRRIPSSIVSRAISVVFFSSLIVVIFTMLILVTEIPEVSHAQTSGKFLEYMFEVMSAFGTVGLSTGVTSELSRLGKILITLLMFIGRLGPLTVTLAVQGKEKRPKFKYVQDSVLVG